MDDVNIVTLTVVSSNFELSMVVGTLEENNIPYLLRDYDAGNYMRLLTGSAMNSTEVLVEESSYTKAKDLIMLVLGHE